MQKHVAPNGQPVERQPMHNVVHLEAASALAGVEIVERHDRLDHKFFDTDFFNLLCIEIIVELPH